jgi:hypothetical protein
MILVLKETFICSLKKQNFLIMMKFKVNKTLRNKVKHLRKNLKTLYLMKISNLRKLSQCLTLQNIWINKINKSHLLVVHTVKIRQIMGFLLKLKALCLLLKILIQRKKMNPILSWKKLKIWLKNRYNNYWKNKNLWLIKTNYLLSFIIILNSS